MELVVAAPTEAKAPESGVEEKAEASIKGNGATANKAVFGPIETSFASASFSDIDALQKQLDTQRVGFDEFKQATDQHLAKAQKTLQLFAGQLGGITEAVEALQTAAANNQPSPSKAPVSSRDVDDVEGLTKEIYTEIRSLKSKVRSHEVSMDAELERLGDEIRAMKLQPRGVAASNAESETSGSGSPPEVTKALAEINDLQAALRSMGKKQGVQLDELQQRIAEVESHATTIREVEIRLEDAWSADRDLLNELKSTTTSNTKRIDALEQRPQHGANNGSPRGQPPDPSILPTNAAAKAKPTAPKAGAAARPVATAEPAVHEPVETHSFKERDEYADEEYEGVLDPEDAIVEDIPVVETRESSSGPGPGPATGASSLGRAGQGGQSNMGSTISEPPLKKADEKSAAAPTVPSPPRQAPIPPLLQSKKSVSTLRRGAASAAPGPATEEPAPTNSAASSPPVSSTSPQQAPSTPSRTGTSGGLNPLKAPAKKSSPTPKAVSITPRERRPTGDHSSPGWAAPKK